MTEVLHVYRTLLRAVDRNITSVTGNPQWRNFIAQEFRKHGGEADPSRVQQLLQEAKDYAFLVTSVREHKDLLLSYNIGIDVDVREREMNRRAANLVGLAMPRKANE